MLKKIFLPLLFIFCISLNAQDSYQTVEDKFAACEKAYDECLTICEETNSKTDECVVACDEKLYICNSKVEEELEKASN